MVWVKCLAHSRASGNGGWSNILTPSCLLSGHVSGGGVFPGPHKPPAEPVEPESSIHSIYKKQHVCKTARPWAQRCGGAWKAGKVWRAGWVPTLTLQELGAGLGPGLPWGRWLGPVVLGASGVSAVSGLATLPDHLQGPATSPASSSSVSLPRPAGHPAALRSEEHLK